MRARSRPRGIRINTVSPGPVETDLWLGEDGAGNLTGADVVIDGGLVTTL